MGIENIVFIVILALAIGLFARQIRRIRKNIALGREADFSGNFNERLRIMTRVALGQSKMVARPIAGFMHIFIYVGFVIINLEVLEIIIDGIFGTHRVFAFLGGFYNFLIASFEILALLVVVSCVVFLARREMLRLPRFWKPEMKGWPRTDADVILVVELVLMFAFLSMNAADWLLQSRGEPHYTQAGSYPVSSVLLAPLYVGLSTANLIVVERVMWWLHIVGILAFLNYLPISKHFHIILAFPNTFFTRLKPMGEFNNLQNVKKEVQLMMDPAADPYAAQAEPATDEAPQRFGARDVTDLTWKNLMDAYTCTECGRCTSECPANITGKKLSPRKIMMDTRDRCEELGAFVRSNSEKASLAEGTPDGKALLHDYITPEELWACTTCNACVQACPVNISPVEIIMDLRRYLVMEESKVPGSLTAMFNNVENNAAPWAFAQADRLKWAEELEKGSA